MGAVFATTDTHPDNDQPREEHFSVGLSDLAHHLADSFEGWHHASVNHNGRTTHAVLTGYPGREFNLFYADSAYTGGDARGFWLDGRSADDLFANEDVSIASTGTSRRTNRLMHQLLNALLNSNVGRRPALPALAAPATMSVHGPGPNARATRCVAPHVLCRTDAMLQLESEMDSTLRTMARNSGTVTGTLGRHLYPQPTKREHAFNARDALDLCHAATPVLLRAFSDMHVWVHARQDAGKIYRHASSLQHADRAAQLALRDVLTLRVDGISGEA